MIYRIQSKWNKLSRFSLKNMESDASGIVSLIQSAYGYTRSQAEREYHDFQLTLRPARTPLAAPERIVTRDPRRF